MPTLISFGFRAGIPKESTALVDCRGIRNPHHDRQLRVLDGRDERVRAYVARDGNFDLCVKEGVAHAATQAVIAFGCFGGCHRSVAVAEAVAAELRRAGREVSIVHRELQSSHTTSQG